MASYIDWYLIELDRRLRGRMPAEPLFSFVSEVEDHLRLKKEDLTIAGMEISQAEKVAVQSFGDADEVALEALDGGSSAHRRAKGGLMALCAMGAIWLFAGVLSAFGFNPSLTLSLFAPFVVAGLVFLVGSAMSRRWQWKNILVMTALGTLLVMLTMPFGFQVANGVLSSRYWIAFDLGWTQRELQDEQAIHQRLDSGLAFYRQLASVKQDLTKVTLTAPKFSDGSFVLLSPYGFDDPGELGLDSLIRGPFHGDPSYYISYGPNGAERASTTDLVKAQKSWLANGAQRLHSVTQRERKLSRELDGLREAQKAPVRFAPPYFISGLGVGLVMTLSLFAVNGVGIAVAHFARRRRIRRPVMA